MNWRKPVFPKCCVARLTARKWLPCWRDACAPPRDTDVTRFPIAGPFCTALTDASGVVDVASVVADNRATQGCGALCSSIGAETI
jgi:hypothetical protein